MMFALLREQHKSQLDAMVAAAAANQKALDAMFERMNAILAGQGKAADNENTLLATGNARGGTGSTKTNKKKCTHCGKHVFHKPAVCYELNANASKRWTGWKSVEDTGKLLN